MARIIKRIRVRALQAIRQHDRHPRQRPRVPGRLRQRGAFATRKKAAARPPGSLPFMSVRLSQLVREYGRSGSDAPLRDLQITGWELVKALVVSTGSADPASGLVALAICAALAQQTQWASRSVGRKLPKQMLPSARPSRRICSTATDRRSRRSDYSRAGR